MEYRNPVEIGEVVCKLRQRYQLDQAEVARHLDIDQPAVSRIERGQRSLSAAELCGLAELFHVDPGAIVRKEEPVAALLRAAGAESESIRRSIEAFELVAREVLAAEALAELL